MKQNLSPIVNEMITIILDQVMFVFDWDNYVKKFANISIITPTNDILTPQMKYLKVV